MSMTQPVWRKATCCAQGNCVEVAHLESAIAVRDSKNCEGLVLTYSESAWEDFIASAKAGAFAIPL